MQLDGACLWVKVCFGMLQRTRMLLGGLIWREPALPSCIVGCGRECVGHLHCHKSVLHLCSSKQRSLTHCRLLMQNLRAVQCHCLQEMACRNFWWQASLEDQQQSESCEKAMATW